MVGSWLILLLATQCEAMMLVSRGPLQAFGSGSNLRGKVARMGADDDTSFLEEESSRQVLSSSDSIDLEAAEMEADLEKLNALRFGTDSLLPPSLPPRGEEPWGRWAQSEDFISLELFVPEATTGKSVLCEYQVGFLDVRLDDDPLLSGRLAQPIMAQEVNWALDDDSASGSRRVLCIELPKRERSIYGADPNDGFTTALFESLRVQGEESVGPGLVAGKYVE